MKVTENTWERVRREAWPHLSNPPFSIIHGVVGVAAGVLAPIVLGEGDSAVSKVIVGVIGFVVALSLVATVVMAWLFSRVPSWQRDEARSLVHQISQQPDSARETDARLLARFLKLLPSNSGPIHMTRNFDFGARWFRGDLEPLRTFATEWSNADHEFIDPDLEHKRKEFLKAVGDFWTIYGQQTFVVQHDPKRSEVPRELRDVDEAKYEEVVGSLNKAASRIFRVHQDLVRVARTRVGDVSD